MAGPTMEQMASNIFVEMKDVNDGPKSDVSGVVVTVPKGADCTFRNDGGVFTPEPKPDSQACTYRAARASEVQKENPQLAGTMTRIDLKQDGASVSLARDQKNAIMLHPENGAEIKGSGVTTMTEEATMKALDQTASLTNNQPKPPGR